MRLAARLIMLLLLLCLAPSMARAAVEPAGFVLMAAGDVVAVQSNQQLRVLARKSPFYPGEILRTGADSKAQVRFRDGSLISLRAETEIRIDEFRFDDPRQGEDRNIFTLISGGFRTITGKIGKQNPEQYQMKSSVASIGVRGTTYEAVLDNGLNVAAWQGTIIVANDTGSIALGAEGVYNFAIITSPTAAPKGMMQPPPSIRDEKEVEPKEMEGDGEKQPLAQRMEQKADGSAAAAPTTSSKTVTQVEREVRLSYEQEVARLQPPPTTPPETAPLPPPVTTPVIEPAPFEPVVTADQRILGINLNRLGLAVAGGTGYTQMLAGGAAGYDANGRFYIADNGFDPSQTGFATTPYNHVLTQGAAAAAAGLPQSLVIDSGHTLVWGAWQGSAAAPVELRTDAANSAIFTALERPVYWADVLVSPATAFGRSGTASYRNVLAFLGGGSGGAINNAYLDLSVNFDTLAANGTVHIYTPAEFWNLSLAGTLTAPVLNFTSLGGTVGAAAIQGEFNAVFSGANAQAIVAAFDLQAAGNPNLHVEGILAANDTAIGDLRLSSTETASLDRIGVALQLNGLAGVERFSGRASNGDLGSPLIVEKSVALSDPAFIGAPALDVLRRGGATLSDHYVNTTHQVSWGVWDAGTQIQLSPYDPLDKLTLSEPLRWMTAQPSAATTMAGLTGAARFVPIQASGRDQLGTPFTAFSAGMKVDFDLAQYKGSALFETGAGEKWNFFFEGNLNGAVLNNSILNGFRLDGLGNQAAINGDLLMLFSGGSGNAIAAAYEFELGTDASKYISGNFLLGKDLRLSATEVAIMGRYGVAMKTQGLAGSEWIAGLASDGAGGSPIIGENFLLAGDPHFYSAPLSGVLKQGAATPQNVMSDTNFPVSWGIWNMGAQLQTDPANAALVNVMTTPMVWMTALPTPQTAVDGRLGKGFYFHRQPCCSGPLFAVTDAGYGIDGIYFELALNYDLGKFNGRLHITEMDSDYWNILFNGDMKGAQLSITGIDPIYSNYTGFMTGTTGVNGDFALLLTGASAEGLAVAYDFESSTNPNYFVQGAFAARQDVRLSLAEMSGMTRVALLSGWGYGFAQSTSASGGQAPVFANDGMGSYAPGDSWFELVPLQSVYRQGSAGETRLPAHQVGGNPAYEVNWGRWDASATTPGVYQWDPADAANQSAITIPLYWISMTPTPPDVLAAKSGTVVYNAPVNILAGSVGGAGDGAINPASFSFSADLNFDTGALANGAIAMSHVGGQTWNMTFTAPAGSMLPSGAFQYISLSGQYNGTFPANGGMHLLLTGANAEGLGGRFNLYDGAALSKDVTGVFLVCQSGGC